MNKNKKNLISLILAMALSGGNAYAGGLLGDLVENACGGCGLGRAGDRLNDQLGNPVDHGAAAVANAYVPGSGAIIEGYYSVQRNGGRFPIQQQATQYGGTIPWVR